MLVVLRDVVGCSPPRSDDVVDDDEEDDEDECPFL